MDLKTRKALTAEYRERPADQGVFQIRNTVDGTVFLDAAADMPARWNRHRFQLDFGNHPNRLLQEQWRRDGGAVFAYEVVTPLEYAAEGPHDVRADLEALLQLCVEDRKDSGAERL